MTAQRREHACPAGQYMVPFPTVHAHRLDDGTRFDVYDEQDQHAELGRPVTAWTETDAHTGCHSPVDPYPAGHTQTRTLWADIAAPVKSAVNAAVSAASLAVEPATSYMLTHYPSAYKTLFFVVCGDQAAFVRDIGKVAVDALTAGSTYVAAKVRKARKAIAVGTGVGVTLVVAEHLFCATAVDPATTTSTTTTTTTTTLPPDETASVPTVREIPTYDRERFTLRGSSLASVEGCRLWVYWLYSEPHRLAMYLCERS